MTTESDRRIGVIHGVSAYILWGLLPIYWKLIGSVPAIEILAHRIVWSLVFLAIILLARRDADWVRQLASVRTVFLLTCSSILIALNWGLYIWAVTHGRIVETSLGYYIAPLVMSMFGVIFLREKLGRARAAALVLASAGVLWLTFLYGSFPWIAIALAFTWSFYGLIRKIAALGSLHGLALETLILTPVAAYYLLRLEMGGTGALGHLGGSTSILLVGAGVATSLPLLFFASAARRLTFVSVGMLQYIAPTLQFLIGIILYGEEAGLMRMIGFGFVWMALLVFVYSVARGQRQEAIRQPGLERS